MKLYSAHTRDKQASRNVSRVAPIALLGDRYGDSRGSSPSFRPMDTVTSDAFGTLTASNHGHSPDGLRTAVGLAPLRRFKNLRDIASRDSPMEVHPCGCPLGPSVSEGRITGEQGP